MTLPFALKALKTSRTVNKPDDLPYYLPESPHLDLKQAAPSLRDGGLRSFLSMPRFWRGRLSQFSFARLLAGGRLSDAGRLPRHVLIAFISLAFVWVPIALYLTLSPLQYFSNIAMILPGAGVSSSVNLSDIGQASSFANSAYSSSSLSPTVTYRSLLQSGQVAQRAGRELGLQGDQIGPPQVKLLDQTSFIRVTMRGPSPEASRARAQAILRAFLFELQSLRNDEIARRQASADGPIEEYKKRVDVTRDKISRLQSASGLTSADQYAAIVEANETLRISVARNRADLESSRRSVESLIKLLRVSADEAALALHLHSHLEFAALAAAAAEASVKLGALSQKYGPNHPKIIDAKAQQRGSAERMQNTAARLTGLQGAGLEAVIDVATDGKSNAIIEQLVPLIAKRDGLVAKLQADESTLEDGERRVRDLVEIASQLDSLSRDYKVAEAVFASALARINSSKSDIFASYPMVQIVEPASLPLEPSSPNRLMAILAGIVASLCIVFAHVLAWIRRPLIDKLLLRSGSAVADA